MNFTILSRNTGHFAELGQLGIQQVMIREKIPPHRIAEAVKLMRRMKPGHYFYVMHLVITCVIGGIEA